MKRQEWVIALAGVAAGAYCIHGFITETGLVGWVNALQQQLFGSYSLKLTMVAALLGLMTAIVGVYSVVARFTGGDDGTMRRLMLGPEGAQVQAPLSNKAVGLSCLVLVAATWVIGFGVQRWMAAEQQQDASARYETITLAGDTAAALPPGTTHVRLQGRLIGDKVLTHKSSGREDYHLVPVASAGWRSGEPVTYVVKVTHLSQLPGQRPVFRMPGQPLPPPEALLGRIDGEVPVPAAQEFRRIGVALAPASHLVRLVPARGEQPDVRDTRDEDFKVFLIICSGVSVLLLLAFALVAFMAARQRRQGTAGRPRASA